MVDQNAGPVDAESKKQLAELETRINAIKADFGNDMSQCQSERNPRKVEETRIKYLSKKGLMSELISILGKVPRELKPEAGKLVNIAKKEVESSIEALQTQMVSWELESIQSQPAVDVSLPALTRQGSLHPVSLMSELLNKNFRKLGFSVYDGPEVEMDLYNFTKLNFPDHHPARDMQDTFFVEGPSSFVMRTHTSPVQIHAMYNEKPPFKIIAPGRVYRCDSDLTHTPMFHQIEALVVDRKINFGHLKGSIDVLIKAVFGSEMKTRLRPSFFPFTEPSAEVDMICPHCSGKGCRVCSQSGWIEIGGCGMVHPNVFENVQIDSERYTGFAFGFGLDRLAMIKYHLSDLRLMFEGNVNFLNQFPVFIA